MALLNLLLILSATASATNLFVSSYAGNITSLSLTKGIKGYELKKTFINDGCSPSPSWLTLDTEHDILYCLDEGLPVPNGSLSSYLVSTDGSLKQVEKQSTISSPVNGVLYPADSTGKRALALAH